MEMPPDRVSKKFHAYCYRLSRFPFYRRRRGEFVEICSMRSENRFRRLRRTLLGVVLLAASVKTVEAVLETKFLVVTIGAPFRSPSEESSCVATHKLRKERGFGFDRRQDPLTRKISPVGDLTPLAGSSVTANTLPVNASAGI